MLGPPVLLDSPALGAGRVSTGHRLPLRDYQDLPHRAGQQYSAVHTSEVPEHGLVPVPKASLRGLHTIPELIV